MARSIGPLLDSPPALGVRAGVALLAGVSLCAALVLGVMMMQQCSGCRRHALLNALLAGIALVLGWTADLPARTTTDRHHTLRREYISAPRLLVSGSWVLHGSSGAIETGKHGLFRLRIPPGLAADRLHPGDKLLVLGVAVAPSIARNPGGFDEAEWMVQSGMTASIDVERIRIDHGHAGNLALRDRVRRRIEERIDALYPAGAVQALVTAMILGDRSDLDPALEDAFRSAGLMHLLAVSGLHFGSIVLLLWLLSGLVVRRVTLSTRAQQLLLSTLVLLAAATYAHLVGWSPSVLRSFLMLGVGLVCRISGRSGWLERSLLLSAWFILAFKPLLWRSVGTQLSFAAVAGIGFGLRRVRSGGIGLLVPGHSLMGKAVQSVFISATAFLGTLPVLLWHMGWVPVMALVLSPPAIVLTSVALMLAAASLLLPVAGMPVALVATQAFRLLAGMSTRVHGHDFPVLHAEGGVDVAAAMALAMCLVVACTEWRRFHRAMTIIGLLATVSFIWSRPVQPSLIMLDVGQGDALIFHAGKRHTDLEDGLPATLVIDTGPGHASGRTIANALARKADAKAGIVLSHGDIDHAGGLETVRTLTGATILMAPWHMDPGIPRTGDSAADKTDATTRGRLLRFGPDLRGYVIHPGTEGRDNAHSLVVLIVVGRTGLLLTGDLEAAGERRLVQDYGPLFDRLETRILKVAHHGSATSSSEVFLDRYRPDVALVSAGINNRFGHPDYRVVERVERSGAIVLSTQEAGAIRVGGLGGSVSIQTHASGRWRRRN